LTSVAPTSGGIDFDPARLRAYLATSLPDITGDMAVERVGGGQSNPTYFLRFDGAELVLRKKPPGDLPPAAHDVGREFRIQHALRDTAVPVPQVRAYCDDDSVVGTPFYLMERLYGRIFQDAALPDVPRAQRRAIYLAQAQALADLHAVDWAAVGLSSLARPGSFLDRQIERWTRAWGDERSADVQAVADWLRQNRPDTEPLALVHGDFKFTNLVFDPTQPRLVGVLDWELAAIGDPLLDVAHIWSAVWATRPDEYGGTVGLDLDELGLPSGDEFAAMYATASGGAVLGPFHRVLALFRNAGIFRGIGERAAAGNANAANAAERGLMGDVYLDRAMEAATAN
jgi:aminoglycoside phosphotransferase (APT) family kinase protein